MLTFVSLCAVSYAALCLVAYLAQAKLVFLPGPAPRTNPGAVGLAFDEVSLDTADGEKLDAWFIRPLGTPTAAVLVCHGNAGSIEDRLHLAQAFTAMGLAVLMFDYRGYGRSSGSPSEEGLYADARTARLHLIESRGFAPEQVIAYGESLGGAVAIELAAEERVGALIVEDTFTSLADAGARHYPWLPVRWLSRYRFDSLAKVASLSLPKLFIHSREDEIVPFEQGRALFEAAHEPKQFLATGGSHNAGGFAVRTGDVARVRAFVDALR